MSRYWPGAALAAAVSLVALTPAPVPAAEPAAAGGSSGVSVFLTDLATRTYLARQEGVEWREGAAPVGPALTIDSQRTYQEMEGFGASFTDSSAWLVGTRLGAAQRDAVMRDLFGRDGDGIGLSFVRQPMGASDFAVRGDYSYDDMPPRQSDPTLSRFSIDHDKSYIIPVLKQAREINPQLTLMATPWSPPGWMKTTDSMIGGELRPDAYQPLAEYFAKFIEAYAAEGVPVRYITPQNEPLYQPAGYPGMGMSAEQQNDLVKNHLGPTLQRHGLQTGILGYDHNWDVPGYPETLYADQDTSPYVTGTAWHCYGGSVRAQSVSHNSYPNKPAYETECSGGTWEGDEQDGFAAAMDLIINSSRDWAKSVVRWNMALDSRNGPTNGGCLTCRGVVTVARGANGKWTYTKTADYWALGQASKFVRPGAHRIASSTLGAGDVQDVAFVNPDGSKALVAFNSGTAARTFRVQWGNRWFSYTLNSGAAATFTWDGAQAGQTDPEAIGSVDVPLDNADGTQALASYDAGMLAAIPQVRIGDQWLGYSTPGGASLTGPTKEEPLDRSGWTVSASASSADDPVGNAVDGDPATRWSTGAGMQPGDWFQLDLGSSRTFDRLVLDTTASPQDFSKQYEVFVSDDGTNWGGPVATGPGDTVNEILLPQVTGRYVRVVNQSSAGNWWSIHEVNVLAPAGPADSVPDPSGDVQRKTAQLPDGTQLLVVYNPGRTAAVFDMPLGGTTYAYRLPAGASAVFTTRAA
ncbi:discoidin domain-containing protein [Streptomyces sp. NPDC051940]|uniref:discoidin domain-containing protein n=1 Tax=Streptomyces sp. NPDC051940 TaxID=3155675 RepID=UPI0034458569